MLTYGKIHDYSLLNIITKIRFSLSESRSQMLTRCIPKKSKLNFKYLKNTYELLNFDLRKFYRFLKNT